MTGPPRLYNPDYLARDYESFRALLLEHLQALAPGSAPFEVASVESTLVETLAYVGDYLSYYQDAVATEAYLATARRRVSIRRHARLLDYVVNEGCSARVWARIEVSAERVTLPRGTVLATRIAESAPPRLPTGSDMGDGEVFETMHEAVLGRAHNRIAPANPGSPPRPGDTEIVLAGSLPDLSPGDVLILRRFSPAWAHAVRLVSVSATQGGTSIVWHKEDSIPADMPSGGEWDMVGNIVLADHGRSGVMPLPNVRREGMEEVDIACPDLAFATPYRHEEAAERPAAEAIRQDPRAAEPAIGLSEEARFLAQAAVARRERWIGRRDLVHAGQFDRVFAAEPTGGGEVNLRFGDGDHGRRLQPDWSYVVHYRAGRGIRGNIGPDTIAHIVSDDEQILRVTNPIAGSGGMDPEALDEIRAQAPLACDVQRRCVTEADYAAMTEQFPGVRSARAVRVWTRQGSNVTIFVCRDRGHGWDQPFADRLRHRIASFQLIGDTVEILSVHYVVPEVALALEITPGRAADEIVAAVRARIIATLCFDFGEALDPARLAGCAKSVPGVIAAGVEFAPVEVAATEMIRFDPGRIAISARQAR